MALWCRKARTMTARNSVIDELEEAISAKEIGSRADTLRRVTDLFLSTAAHASGERMAVFDEVMSLLVREVETSARASFGQRLAAVRQVPPRVIRVLALDDAIEV